MTNGWRLAWRNLARNRRRNVATGVAIALGFAGLLLLGGYILRVEGYLRISSVYLQQVGHVSIYKRDGLERFSIKPQAYGLTAQEQKLIAEVLTSDRNVEAAGRFLIGAGLAGNGCKTVPFYARGIEPQFDRKMRHHPRVESTAAELALPTKGKDLAEYANVPSAVGLATGLARLLGKTHVHDELPKEVDSGVIADCGAPFAAEQIAKDANVQLAAGSYEGRFSAVDGEVVNWFSTGLAELEDAGMLAPLTLLQELYETDVVTYFAAVLAEPKDIEAYADRLERSIREKGVDVDVYPFTDEAVNPYYVGTMGFLYVMGMFIVLVVFTVVVLSILNSMTMTIIERTREIGTFRSLGFTRGQILRLFLYETTLLATIALAAGLVLGLLTAAMVNALDIRFSPPGVAGTMQFLLKPNAALCAILAALTYVLAWVATTVAVRARLKQSVAELMTALST